VHVDKDTDIGKLVFSERDTYVHVRYMLLITKLIISLTLKCKGLVIYHT